METLKEIIVTIWIAICAIGLLFCVYMLNRNYRVFKRKGQMATKVFNKQNSIEEYNRLLAVLESVTYSEMFYSVWIPVNYFYKDEL